MSDEAQAAPTPADKPDPQTQAPGIQRPKFGDAEHYRKQAEDARRWAANAEHADDKAFWLRMAEDWDKLARSMEERRRGR